MLTIHTLTLYAHILFGSTALLLFWVPMIAPKGQLNHIKYGKFYNGAMYFVAATAAITALIVLWDPMAIHGQRLSNPDNTAIFIDKMRVFYGLLFYLSILIYAGLRHGILVLRHKKEPFAIKRPDVLIANTALVLSAPILCYLGVVFNQTLAIIFSVIGLLSGMSNLKYILASNLRNNRNPHYEKENPKAWLKEHIGALIGTGIGAHTAFFAFGGRSIFGDIGNYQLIFWIAPGVLGGFAIRFYSSRYAPKRSHKISHTEAQENNVTFQK